MSGRATAGDLKKAKIQVLDGSGGVDRELTALFNPTEYSLEKSVNYGTVAMPGFTSPVTQFIHGERESLSMELFFDTYEDGEDVRSYTDEIDALVRVDGDLHAPPVVRFVWGSFQFKSVVTSVEKRFTMFLDDGTPVRARLTVTFEEYTTPERQRAEQPRHSADRSTAHRVTEGDTLWAIAADEYGDPGEWRAIASENDIVNPRSIEPGTELAIPPLER
ncbi:LysM peptidoglycan-binding domain-containing protein [Halopenitus sp. H-Gu1]|uniref:CIS tube protein n=1 Tax=Halopenitus sp. H-Gu1 TaxID=3242697 RepID=UPI00359DF000